MTPTLSPDRRTQLDDIVKRLDAFGASSDEVRAVVSDFTGKYAGKSGGAPTPTESHPPGFWSRFGEMVNPVNWATGLAHIPIMSDPVAMADSMLELQNRQKALDANYAAHGSLPRAALGDLPGVEDAYSGNWKGALGTGTAAVALAALGRVAPMLRSPVTTGPAKFITPSPSILPEGVSRFLPAKVQMLGKVLGSGASEPRPASSLERLQWQSPIKPEVSPRTPVWEGVGESTPQTTGGFDPIPGVLPSGRVGPAPIPPDLSPRSPLWQGLKPSAANVPEFSPAPGSLPSGRVPGRPVLSEPIQPIGPKITVAPRPAPSSAPSASSAPGPIWVDSPEGTPMNPNSKNWKHSDPHTDLMKQLQTQLQQRDLGPTSRPGVRGNHLLHELSSSLGLDSSGKLSYQQLDQINTFLRENGRLPAKTDLQLP